MRIWNLLERYPPFIVRLLARKPGPGGKHHPVPMTWDEIAQRSGIPTFRLIAMSDSPNWDKFTIEEMRQFTIGCGIDMGNPDQMKRISAYMLSPSRFHYAKRGPEWPTLRPLFVRWKSLISKP